LNQGFVLWSMSDKWRQRSLKKGEPQKRAVPLGAVGECVTGRGTRRSVNGEREIGARKGIACKRVDVP
jgi:hypothetical protein